MKSYTLNKAASAKIILLCCCVQLCWSDFEPGRNFEELKNYDSTQKVRNYLVLPSAEKALCTSFNSLEFCEDEGDNLSYNLQLRKRQRAQNAELTSFVSAIRRDKAARNVQGIYQTNQRAGCSCAMENQTLDFGLSSYPRYVPTVVCKQEGCLAGYKCHPKKYKVHVLKPKQPEDADSKSAGLPDILKDWFVLETITVTVACECGP